MCEHELGLKSRCLPSTFIGFTLFLGLAMCVAQKRLSTNCYFFFNLPNCFLSQFVKPAFKELDIIAVILYVLHFYTFRCRFEVVLIIVSKRSQLFKLKK